MGPVTFMLNYPDHCVLYRFIPRSLTETDMELVWFVREDAQEGIDYDVDKVTWLWHHTTLEDEYIITRNAAGVNSRFLNRAPITLNSSLRSSNLCIGICTHRKPARLIPGPHPIARHLSTRRRPRARRSIL